MKNICVFLGSRMGQSPLYEKATIELGRQMAQSKFRLVYGGGRVGLMGLLADTVLAEGGEVIGVIPRFMSTKEISHDGLTQLYEVQTMHERKALMENLSEAFIAIPGGFGTMDEMCEIITWFQIGLHKKPMAFLNTDGFFNSFFKFIEGAVHSGFIPTEHWDFIIRDSEPASVISEISRRLQGPPPSNY